MRRMLLLLPAVLLAAGCGAAAVSVPPAVRAAPQRAVLGWSEQYPAAKPALAFGVTSFAVTETGWSADISFRNRSRVSWQVGDPRRAVERAFGVLLFPDDDITALERRNREGTLPAIRKATVYDPPLPKTIEPGASWRGTISAPGALAAGLWVRLSFGTFTAAGTPPPGAQQRVVWFTDHAYRLKVTP
ncbi:hypothetical protein Gocc_1670 [Gaiella occulta]|uniref:Lipoprotein n=1 Tax=Gaiella occulta TaxID=1002870 RepID=A0A7M2YXB6_9ACTN|nr:hypothetical protein [Gaiella occulta]RDI74781.1 hypothetical protein Gocc_1670 [Gaiella occulta]